jgi:cation diffusion facilitator family transporter
MSLMPSSKPLRVTALGILVNLALAITKIVSGLVGNAYALIADGVESLMDIFSSGVIWGGLKIAAVPADHEHPYGHGKAEAIAAATVALVLLATAAVLAFNSVREILTPHHAPAPFTLLVLIGVILIKESLFRFVFKVGAAAESTALKVDAWHHRSDALTSLAAFVGISISLIAGEGYESADDWAALLACGIIAWNGTHLLRMALAEIMDSAPSPALVREIRARAQSVAGIIAIEKCFVRKSGTHYFVDLHVVVDGDISVRQGHALAHEVKDALLASELHISNVLVHVEPDEGERR